MSNQTTTVQTPKDEATITIVLQDADAVVTITGNVQDALNTLFDRIGDVDGTAVRGADGNWRPTEADVTLVRDDEARSATLDDMVEDGDELYIEKRESNG